MEFYLAQEDFNLSSGFAHQGSGLNGALTTSYNDHTPTGKSAQITVNSLATVRYQVAWQRRKRRRLMREIPYSRGNDDVLSTQGFAILKSQAKVVVAPFDLNHVPRVQVGQRSALEPEAIPYKIFDRQNFRQVATLIHRKLVERKSLFGIRNVAALQRGA